MSETPEQYVVGSEYLARIEKDFDIRKVVEYLKYEGRCAAIKVNLQLYAELVTFLQHLKAQDENRFLSSYMCHLAMGGTPVSYQGSKGDTYGTLTVWDYDGDEETMQQSTSVRAKIDELYARCSMEERAEAFRLRMDWLHDSRQHPGFTYETMGRLLYHRNTYLKKEYLDPGTYYLYNVMIGSTPRETSTKWDFPGQDSIEEWLAALKAYVCGIRTEEKAWFLDDEKKSLAPTQIRK